MMQRQSLDQIEWSGDYVYAFNAPLPHVEDIVAEGTPIAIQDDDTFNISERAYYEGCHREVEDAIHILPVGRPISSSLKASPSNAIE
ncbi:hypothetical protein Ancab_025470 [Ancistrocladus abbreviatus]